jgi:hypothetical protein
VRIRTPFGEDAKAERARLLPARIGVPELPIRSWKRYPPEAVPARRRPPKSLSPGSAFRPVHSEIRVAWGSGKAHFPDESASMFMLTWYIQRVI